MLTQLIINADDFGASHEVNEAVAEARRHGVLTSASLMVTGDALSEAVAIARSDPGLAVGLHLTLSSGVSRLPRALIPGLVDENSRFPSRPEAAGFKYYLDPRARRELRLEIEAQFQAFAETGLPLSHVDGHQHLHAHPAVLPVVVPLAISCGAHGIRIPCEPFWPGILADRTGLGAKLTVALGHRYLARACRRLLQGTKLKSCDICIGSLMSGKMSADYAVKMLKSVDCSSAEVYFHPSVEDGKVRFGPNHGDLQALLDPALAKFIEETGCTLTNYEGLKR